MKFNVEEYSMALTCTPSFALIGEGVGAGAPILNIW